MIILLPKHHEDGVSKFYYFGEKKQPGDEEEATSFSVINLWNRIRTLPGGETEFGVLASFVEHPAGKSDHGEVVADHQIREVEWRSFLHEFRSPHFDEAKVQSDDGENRRWSIRQDRIMSHSFIDLFFPHFVEEVVKRVVAGHCHSHRHRGSCLLTKL